MLDLEEATRWIDVALARTGRQRTGPLESVRTRPWGEIARAESNQGPVWLKAPGRTTAFEVPLYELLSRRAPEAILVPLAVSRRRGWVLLPEGGPPLGETAEGEALIEGLIAALERYGRLQRALAGDVDGLLAVGVEDMRPAAMPARFGEAVAAGERYLAAHGSAEDRAALDRAVDQREAFLDRCNELATRPGGASLDHNDLHPWNILGRARDPATLRFYDWGDSVLAHPFAAMLVPLGFIERLAPAELERGRDAYLATFDDLAAPDELVDTLELACHVAKVARALTWERALLTADDPDDVDGEFARAPLVSLASVADASPFGQA